MERPRSRTSAPGPCMTRPRTALELHPREFPEPPRRRAEVLNVPEEEGGGRQAVANGCAQLESHHRAKGAGGMVRTMAEWPSIRRPSAGEHCRCSRSSRSRRAGEKLPDGEPAAFRRPGARPDPLLAGRAAPGNLAEHGADVLKITPAHLPNLGYRNRHRHGKLSGPARLRDPQQLAT